MVTPLSEIMVPFIKLRGKHDCLPLPVGWNCPVYRGHYSLITPRRVYVRKLKGTFEFDLKNRCLFCWKSEFVFKKLNWKIEVCFKKNGSLFSEMGVWIKEFAFENGSMFWKMEVCFPKSEFESGSLFSKIAVENQNLLSKIGVWCRRLLGESRLSFGPRLCGGVDV